jgi:hypothetical protein
LEPPNSITIQDKVNQMNKEESKCEEKADVQGKKKLFLAI